MARRRIITLLMPPPTFYNPDPEGVRKPIERWKFTRTAEEISRHFGAGAELQVFRRDRPQGFWWDRGLLSKDVLAYISADLPDTDATREWMQTYARKKLIARFRQDAIYLRWLSIETELVRPVERVTRSEEE
jgi:hypothetical protein